MKRALFGLLLVGVVAYGAFELSSAFFSDSETSTGNVFQAGILDLLIDNTSYYNGEYWPDTSWTLDNLTGHLFFNFTDIKPGHWGEDTVSIHVNDNPAWVCFDIEITENDDISCIEPETVDDPDCDEPNGNLFDGELADQIEFVFWNDDGDNVLEEDEIGKILAQGTIGDVMDGFEGALVDSENNNLGGQVGEPLAGGVTAYIGKAWCFGEMTIEPVLQDGEGFMAVEGANGPDERGPGITCDGELVNNAAQSDRVMGDISFYAEQYYSNPDFLCVQPDVTPTPTPTVCEERWADAVTADSNNQGTRKDGSAVLVDRTDPTQALVAETSGDPYDSPVLSGTFFSLGFVNGNLTVEFTTPIANHTGNDLKIFEVTGGSSYPDEKVQVEASSDNSTWTELTSSLTRDGEVDLGVLGSAKYIRLTEVSNMADFSSNADGYDLDGVRYICP